MREELGVIKNVGFGMRDFHNGPGLWWDVHTLSGLALHSFFGESAAKVIKDANVYDIKFLEGKVCVCEVGDGLIKFVRMFK